MNILKYNIEKRTSSSIVLEVAYIRDEVKIRYIVENAGASNLVRIEGRIVGQSSWDILLDITSTDNQVVDVATYEEVRVSVLTYDSLSNYVDIIGSSFDNVSTATGGLVDSVNGQTGVVVINAIDVPYDDTITGYGLFTVQETLDQLFLDEAGTNSALAAHITETVGAHEASAISVSPQGGISSIEVQAALEELQADIDTRALDSDLQDHINEPIAAHAASAISNIPSGNLSATEVQAALNELDTEKEPTITVLPIAKGGTNSSTALTNNKLMQSLAGSIVEAPNTEIGVLDAFSRTKLWYYSPDSILKLGSWEADGDATSVNSEGEVIYGVSVTGGAISATNGGYARIKANRFGLFTIDSTLPAYAGGDYYFRVDPTSLFFKNNSAVKTFEVARTTGQITTSMGAGFVQSSAGGVLSSTSITATNISNTPSGNLSATDVQAALNELQSDIDTRALDTDVIKHDGSVAFTGDQSMGGFNLTNLADPVAAQDAATKAYVDAVAEGLKPKQAVRAGTLVNGALATDFENGDVIDGVTLATGDRILIKDQTDASENGIYIVEASGAPTRAPDFDSLSPIDEINGSYTFIQEGSQAGQGWVQTGEVVTIGVSDINFVFFNSVAGIIGGDGITVTGNTIDVDHDGEGLTFVATQLALELDGVTLSKSATGLKLGDTAVTPGTYGSASETVTLTVDQQGRLTAASEQTISITASQVSDFNTAASAAAPVQSVNAQTGIVVLDSDDIAEGTNLYFTDERVDDRVAALIVAGMGITSVYSDAGNTLTISTTITQYTDEMTQDAVGTILTDSNTIDFTYNDGAPSIVADVRTQMSITSDASGIKLVNDATTPGNTYYYGTDGAGVKGFFAITAQGSAGDIPEMSFSLANNQVTPADVTGFLFPVGTVRSFSSLTSVEIDATADLYEQFTLKGINKAVTFDMSQDSVGDTSGVVFSITSTGQVQYTSANYAGFVSGFIKFRAITTTV